MVTQIDTNDPIQPLTDDDIFPKTKEETAIDIAQASNPGIDDQIAQIDAQLANMSFGQGLAGRREALSQAQLGQTEISGRQQALEDFQASPAYKANLEAIRGSRAVGESPLAVLQDFLGVRRTSEQIRERGSLAEIQAGKDVTKALFDLLDFQEEKLTSKRAMLEAEKDRKKADLLDGVVWDDETGDYRKANTEDFLVTPEGLALTDEQKSDAKLTGTDAVTKVKQQTSDDEWKALTSGTTPTKVPELAESILRQGGYSEWIKGKDIKSLYNEKELIEDEAQTNVVGQAEKIITNLEDGDNVFGIGFGEGLIGSLAGKVGALPDEAIAVRSALTEFTAEKIKEISGATVSDKEVQRLIDGGFLPSVSDSESTILAKAKYIRSAILANQEIFQRAKRERLLVSEAFDKYSDEIYNKFGLNKANTWSSASETSPASNFQSNDELLDEIGIK